MKTDFFRRKTLALAGVLSAATVLSGIFYAHALTRAIVADVSETFYFLVSEEENVPASAWDAYLGGGAGLCHEPRKDRVCGAVLLFQ